ncbi:hypothetical protein MPTP_0910 [Melissococcus plutonius ATCC 35311]|uniref:Uncharacterized protein n=1 Tax=Melissococcus plutonius (strain ATCC 35311 / DSM 29964 / CIP 104052 / LMG 20360 / NCIMB 702443) TaxID=940190 RepID=F3YA42_MELPT|nr:hypothetical protein MPTP_0910 [Melissococcus plutonius ATCC 35311]
MIHLKLNRIVQIHWLFTLFAIKLAYFKIDNFIKESVF